MTCQFLRVRPRWPLALSVVSLLAIAPSIVLGQGQILNQSLTHAGYTREYYLYVPSGYSPDNSTPVIFNIHGWAADVPYLSGWDQMQWTGMNSVAEREGFLTVYPSCYRDEGGPGVGWLAPEGTNRYDDVGFFDTMIGELSSQYSIDASRIYVTGLSFGGLMTYALGAARPYTYAAIAPVAGDRPRAKQPLGTTDYSPLNVPNTPGRPFPVLHIHGTVDHVIRYAGGLAGGWTFPPVEEVVGKYAQNNGADSIPSVVDLPNISTNDDSTVQVLTYDNPDTYLDVGGDYRVAETLLYRIVNGGHNWPDMVVTPQQPPRDPPVNRDINANEVIWDFFSRHVLAAKPLPGDYNGDSVVNALDYDTWKSAFGSTTGLYAGADGNGNGIVDAADYTVWRNNLDPTDGLGTWAIASASAEAGIPEPSAVLLLAVALVVVAATYRTAISISPQVRGRGVTVVVVLLGVLSVRPPIASAVIYRWDNGELIPGSEGIAVQPSMDLSYWNTESHNLRFADFEGSWIYYANFAHSWLDWANLSRTYLYDANLAGTSLEGARFVDADLRDAQLPDAILVGANLTNARFIQATLAGADLSGAIVTGANFANTTSRGFTKEQLYATRSYQEKDLHGIWLSGYDNDLTGWDFSGQDLTDAGLESGKIAGADFTGAIVTGRYFGIAVSRGFTKEQLYSTRSYQLKNLQRITLGWTDLKGWDFGGQDLTGAYLDGDGSRLTGANLAGANLTNAALGWLAGADLTDAVVTGASLRGLVKQQLYSTKSYRDKTLQGIGLGYNGLAGWDFSEQDLTNADLQFSIMAETNLGEAIIEGADLRATTSGGFTKEQFYSTRSYQDKNLHGVGLGENDLTGWNFTGQNLTNAELYSATLTDTDFSDAVIDGTDLRHTTSRGFTKEQLYSARSYQKKSLQGIQLAENDIAGWNFSGQNLSEAVLASATLTGINLADADLTNADLSFATLTDANLSGAIIAGANFAGTAGYALYEEPSRGFTKELLYSTRSYAEKDLRGIHFEYNDLVGWDFSGQNLQDAIFGTGCGLGGCDIANTTNADFSAADLRGTNHPFLGFPGIADPDLTRNAILENGWIQGLELTEGNTLVVRDDDGHISEYYGYDPLPITIEERMSVAAGARLQLILEADSWDSTILFEPGIPVSLGGTLELLFAPEVDVSTQVGRTFQIFDWTGVTPGGAFTVESPYVWNLSELYTSGTVMLTGVPEPSLNVLIFVVIPLLCARRRC